MEGLWSWFKVKQKDQQLEQTNQDPGPTTKLICSSDDIKKDGEGVLCCWAQDQSTSGHNIANYMYKVDMFFLIYTSIGL
jgi:hypothetical protein